MSAKASTVYSDRIEYGYWLVFGADGALRFTRTEPTTSRGERAMSCVATLPRSLFKTPELRATLTVADTGAPAIEIDVNAAAAALSQVVGCFVQVEVIDPTAAAYPGPPPPPPPPPSRA